MSSKIIEIKGTDFLKGKSAQPNLPIGGLFQSYFSFDPFEQSGVMRPSLSGTPFVPMLSGSPAAVKFLSSWTNGTTNYVYGALDGHLLRILKDSPYTVTDVTSEITPRTTIRGAIIWNGKYVYAPDGGATSDLRINALPVAAGSDVQIFASWNDVLESRPMVIGADGNLYAGGNPCIYVITSSTGTAGNFKIDIDANFTVRDLINDGRYLVILADNNTQQLSKLKLGDYRARIYFWDMVKTQSSGTKILPDVVYDLVGENYLIGGKFIDNGIYFFGYNGIYVCNSATSPKMIRPFTGTYALTKGKPFNSYQISASKGSLYWVQGSSDATIQGRIYAYGNPITGQPKIFYEPYPSVSSFDVYSLISIGEQLWTADAQPGILIHNSGTRGWAEIKTTVQTMNRPHRYDYTKVVLTAPLVATQSVQVQIFNGNGTSLSDETINFSAAGSKQTLIFRRVPGTNSPDKFEEIYTDVIANNGAAIQRVSVYATPLEDGGQDL